MAEPSPSGCPSQEELVDYFRLRLPEARLLAIEAHFATCDLCLEESRTVFETLVDLDSCTPASVGAAARRESLVTALEQARQNEPSGSEWSERLKRWSKKVVRAADGGVELIVEASGARLVANSLREIVALQGMQFEPVRADRAEPAGGGKVPPPTAEVLSVQKPEVRVQVGSENLVKVSIQAWPPDQRAPGILVVDESGKHPPLRLELQPRDAGEYFVQFSRGEGEYMILFAPIEKKG
jgi:hypothetical protein